MEKIIGTRCWGGWGEGVQGRSPGGGFGPENLFLFICNQFNLFLIHMNFGSVFVAWLKVEIYSLNENSGRIHMYWEL